MSVVVDSDLRRSACTRRIMEDFFTRVLCFRPARWAAVLYAGMHRQEVYKGFKSS